MNRRIFLQAAVLSGIPVGSCVSDDGSLRRTTTDVEGPFYPVEPIPLDSSLILNEGFVGDDLEFSGAVLSAAAQPVPLSKIEIWQCDGNSVYNHPAASSDGLRDIAFRGFGACRCDDQGRFVFRTIVPVAYPERPPHIHVKVWAGDKEVLTTQVYLQGARSPGKRTILPRTPVQDAKFDYSASFDFIV